MVRKTTGLGRGLGALIPSEAATSSQAFRHIPIDQIVANPNQPRRHFDEEALDALAASIRMLGVLQPVLVRPSGDGYELIAGERRWRAARRAGLSDLPAVVREQDDGTALVEAVVENIQRQDLHALEEAAAYRQLLEDFDLTHEALAERVGRSRASITNTLRLLQLPTAVQRLVADRRLTAGHARAVLAVPDPAAQQELANRIVREDLSVRAAEAAARDHLAEDGTARVTTRRAPPVAPPPKAAALLELEERLAEQLSTNVEVTMTGKRGRIVIDFATVDDLERIYRALSVGFEPSIDG